MSSNEIRYSIDNQEKIDEKLEKIRNQESDRQKFIAKIKDLTV